MRLSLAGKLLAAGVAAQVASAGLRHIANNMDDGSSGGNTVMLSADQMNAAQHFANASGISLREAVLRLYNLNLID
jgi:hypothetical protein